MVNAVYVLFRDIGASLIDDGMIWEALDKYFGGCMRRIVKPHHIFGSFNSLIGDTNAKLSAYFVDSGFSTWIIGIYHQHR